MYYISGTYLFYTNAESEAIVTILVPELVMETVLGKNDFGKSLIERTYRNTQTGEERQFGVFDWRNGKVLPSMVLPITQDGQVVAIRQFREGAGKVILELPGGNPEGNQTPEEVACAELLQETGYAPHTMISLSPNRPIFAEPASFTVAFHPFLAIGCHKCAPQQLDRNENIEVDVMPWEAWLKACYEGAAEGMEGMAITFLALPHVNALHAEIHSM